MLWKSAPEFPVSSVSGTTHCCRVSFEGDDLTMATGQAVISINVCRCLLELNDAAAGLQMKERAKGEGWIGRGVGPHPDRGPDEVQEWRLLQLRFPNRIFGVDL